MHVTRTIPAVLTATALVLTSCSSTEGGIGAPAALETNGDEVIQDADGTGAEVSQRLFESSETVVVSAKERDQQLKAAAIAVKLGAPVLVRGVRTRVISLSATMGDSAESPSAVERTADSSSCGGASLSK